MQSTFKQLDPTGSGSGSGLQQPPSSSLHHKASIATSNSHTSSNQSSVNRLHHAPPLTSSTSQRRRRMPIYVRIVPKDIWLRFHITPNQTIGSIKDSALIRAGAPEHDPSMSYRFYNDAIQAYAQAKLAPVASQHHMIKHRNYSLPKSFAAPTPAPDLSATFTKPKTAKSTSSPSQYSSSLPPAKEAVSSLSSHRSPTKSTSSHVSGLSEHNSNVKSHSTQSPSQRRHQSVQQQSGDEATVGSQPSPNAVLSHSRTMGSSSSTRSMSGDDGFASGKRGLSTSTSATSPLSSDIDSDPAFEVAIRLDSSLITGNREAKEEEERARARLFGWTQSQSSPAASSTAARASSGAIVQPSSSADPQAYNTLQSRSTSSPLSLLSGQSVSSPNSTPTIGSSSHTDESRFTSQNLSTSDEDASFRNLDQQSQSLARNEAPAAYAYTTASDSMHSIASHDDQDQDDDGMVSDSSAELLTTADSSGMQWGTQAENLQSRPDSSPASPNRARSRTVTAADAGPRNTNVNRPEPSSAITASSSQVPRSRLVAETSQRRAMPNDLLQLLTDPDAGETPLSGPRNEMVDVDSPTSFNSSKGKEAEDGPESMDDKPSMRTPERGRLAGIHMDEMSQWREPTHPLSNKYSMISFSNGCVLEDWKTVAAYKISPYELLEMQWSVPTERVHIANAPMEMIREAVKESRSEPGLESSTLEPYFEGWVYMLKRPIVTIRPGRNEMGKWKLRWITVKGWRLDMYRKKPRAGEISLPTSEHIWPLLGVKGVWTNDSPINVHAALPALETLPSSSITMSFTNTLRSGGVSEPMIVASTLGLTLRCITQFDHDALVTLLQRAYHRARLQSGTEPDVAKEQGIDAWRRKAVFRALVAGRGGTVQTGRAGRARGRNAKARVRLRPSGWAREWEDADLWSSESEGEQVSPVGSGGDGQAGLVGWTGFDAMGEGERSHESFATSTSSSSVAAHAPHGLHAAFLGKTKSSDAATRHWRRSVHHSERRPNEEPGLMLGSHSMDNAGYLSRGTFRSADSKRIGAELAASREKSSTADSRQPQQLQQQQQGQHKEEQEQPVLWNSDTSSPSASASGTARSSNTVSPQSRSRSHTISASAHGSGSLRTTAEGIRNTSREGSPLPPSGSQRAYSPSRIQSNSRKPVMMYPMAPALAPGHMDIPPPKSLALLKKFKTSSNGAKQQEQ